MARGSLARVQVQLLDSLPDIVDIKPANMEELTEVITAAEFHPHHCNTFVYSSSKGTIRLCDMRTAALCDRHAKCEYTPPADGAPWVKRAQQRERGEQPGPGLPGHLARPPRLCRAVVLPAPGVPRPLVLGPARPRGAAAPRSRPRSLQTPRGCSSRRGSGGTARRCTVTAAPSVPEHRESCFRVRFPGGHRELHTSCCFGAAGTV